MNELNKIRKIFAGRTHKLSGKVKLEIEKGQEKHRTIIAPYEPTVEKLQALITEQVRLDREKYDELIMAVETKVEGQSRHETALMYIKQAENRSSDTPQAESDTTLLEGEKK